MELSTPYCVHFSRPKGVGSDFAYFRTVTAARMFASRMGVETIRDTDNGIDIPTDPQLPDLRLIVNVLALDPFRHKTPTNEREAKAFKWINRRTAELRVLSTDIESDIHAQAKEEWLKETILCAW